MGIYKNSLKNKKNCYSLRSSKKKKLHSLDYTKTNNHQKNIKICQSIISKSSHKKELLYIDNTFRAREVKNTNKEFFNPNDITYKDTKFFKILYGGRCKNYCNMCENGNSINCSRKKKKKHEPFYLYKQDGELYLMVLYNNNSPIIMYEILEKLSEFMDYYENDITISKSRVYNLKTHKLVDSNFNKALKIVSLSNNNKDLFSELKSYNNERYIVFFDTEGGEILKEVGYCIYDTYKEILIEEKDSRDTSVNETISKLNKLISKNKNDIVLCSHHTEHDANIMRNNGFIFDQTTKFCCSSRNNNFKDLDQLCEYFNVPNEEPRHIAIVDAKLILECFLKASKQEQLKFLRIQNYKIL